MNEFVLETPHKDSILDVSFNYFSDRLATASADHTLIIWNKDNENHKFNKVSTLEGHFGPIYKVEWAQPQFGSIIATCSFDKKVRIFEEVNTIRGKEWKLKSEWKEDAVDIKFGPFLEDFILAVATSEGKLKIYQPYSDINPSNWKLNDEIMINMRGLTSISWRKCNFGVKQLVIGCREGGENLFIYNYTGHKKLTFFASLTPSIPYSSDIYDVSWAPSNGKSFEIIVSCSEQGISVWTFNYSINNSDGPINLQEQLIEESIGATNVHWNPIASLLASSDAEGRMKIWKINGTGQLSLLCDLCTESSSVNEDMEIE